MLAHDNLLQAEKTLQNALTALGKANSYMSRGISLENSASTYPDADAGGWGSSGVSASGVWGSGGSSGFAFGGVEGYIAMAMNSVNLALSALHYYPEQP